MGRRGPPPKPTALKLLQGNPGKRAINAREPKPRGAIARCPDWLDEEGKACWKRLIPELKRMGVITCVDVDALCNYCDSWSRWKRAVLFLQKNGDVYTIKNPDGTAKFIAQLPQVAIARNLLAALLGFQREFGMTPASRSRIVVEQEQSSPGIAEFLGFGISKSA